MHFFFKLAGVLLVAFAFMAVGVGASPAITDLKKLGGNGFGGDKGLKNMKNFGPPYQNYAYGIVLYSYTDFYNRRTHTNVGCCRKGSPLDSNQQFRSGYTCSDIQQGGYQYCGYQVSEYSDSSRMLFVDACTEGSDLYPSDGVYAKDYCQSLIGVPISGSPSSLGSKSSPNKVPGGTSH
ncbi:hypothetical protein FA10DRAFT_302954 [Acaromyces ingoldii]|uniref:Uncharacterized protein n=1 Tax=Acaromyces ingoldii TaxID=215250 RepID=A0A316YPG8_9BASI|nr:hypothetical protein FA10DRAFT_302954 [Acaromyces ingoldii]PWN89635.1 hypothetical protein FA10DRAFT_302954 [Acaromyces ingoldii]